MKLEEVLIAFLGKKTHLTCSDLFHEKLAYNFLRRLSVSLGTSDWCLPFIGFAGNTRLAIQIWGW